MRFRCPRYGEQFQQAATRRSYRSYWNTTPRPSHGKIGQKESEGDNRFGAADRTIPHETTNADVSSSLVELAALLKSKCFTTVTVVTATVVTATGLGPVRDYFDPTQAVRLLPPGVVSGRD